MTRLVELLSVPVLPERPIARAVLGWLNFGVAPLLFAFLGLRLAWAAATTPFELFLGTAAALTFALVWPVFVRALPRREGVA